jgi:hypothetical protein
MHKYHLIAGLNLRNKIWGLAYLFVISYINTRIDSNRKLVQEKKDSNKNYDLVIN